MSKRAKFIAMQNDNYPHPVFARRVHNSHPYVYVSMVRPVIN